MTEAPSPESKNSQLRSWGLAVLFLGMAVGGVGRTLHASDTVKIGMSIASGLLSLGAIGLFFKASKKRSTIVATSAAFLVVCLAVAALMIYK